MNMSPSLALIIGQPLSTGSQEGMEVDSEVSYTEEQLKPLFEILGKLYCLVEDRLHLQQVAGTTKVGYNAYYDYKLAKTKGLTDFSGFKADKEFWY